MTKSLAFNSIALIYYLLLFLLISLFTINAQVTSGSRVESSAQASRSEIKSVVVVVERFCILSKEGRFDDLRGLITRYDKQPAFLFLSPQSNATQVDERLAKPTPERKSPSIEFDLSELESVEFEFVTNLVPKAINEMRMYIKSVEETKVEKNHAFVRIAFGSDLNENFLGCRDFYLVRTDKGEWKIFKIESVSLKSVS